MQNNTLRKKFDMDKYLSLVGQNKFSYFCPKMFVRREVVKYMSILWHSVSMKLIVRLAKDLRFPHPNTAITFAIGGPTGCKDKDMETMHAWTFNFMRDRLFDRLYTMDRTYSKIEISCKRGGKPEFVMSRRKVMTDPYQCVILMTFMACKELEESSIRCGNAPEGFITTAVKVFKRTALEKPLS